MNQRKRTTRSHETGFERNRQLRGGTARSAPGSVRRYWHRNSLLPSRVSQPFSRHRTNASSASVWPSAASSSALVASPVSRAVYSLIQHCRAPPPHPPRSRQQRPPKPSAHSAPGPRASRPARSSTTVLSNDQEAEGHGVALRRLLPRQARAVQQSQRHQRPSPGQGEQYLQLVWDGAVEGSVLSLLPILFSLSFQLSF